MILPAITRLSRQEIDENNTWLADFKKNSGFYNEHGNLIRNKLFKDYHVSNKYGSNSYYGQFVDGVILSEHQLSMVLDNGCNYFGGESFITRDGHFRVEIWTD